VIELTPSGRGAVAVVLVAGPDAASAVGKCFHSVRGRPLDNAPLGRILLGRWGGPEGEELIVCRREREQIEVHCHGGVAAAHAVIQQLVDDGCHRVTWQQWLQHTPGELLTRAAQIALAEAPTARTAAILLDQFHGSLSDALARLAAAISAGDWPNAADTLDALQAYRGVGLHLTTPWRVVLAGPTNVGKSSLINALAGFERAIISPRPGTTRDVVTTLTAIDGWPVELADTAGLRDTEDALEAAGVELAAQRIAAADLVVMVKDAQELVSGAERGTSLAALVARRAPADRILCVTNKIDLVGNAGRSRIAGSGGIPTSALTGEGVPDLIIQIGRALVPAAPPFGAAVPFAATQFAALDAASAAIGRHDAAAAIAALQPMLAP
jgi:tRNA modification GTPase